MEIEETVIRYDGAGASHEELAQARQKITGLESTVAGPEFQALLAAWSGRLYLLEGKNAEAQREYRKSINSSPGNLPSIILSSRLERDIGGRLSVINRALESEEPRGELLAERGRILFDINRYSESLAAFDTAFNMLGEKPYYEEAYKAFREKAWELKNLAQAGSNAGIVRQGEISWKELIEITRDETDFLVFITAGRDWPAESLFSQLLERSFIPIIQDVEKTEWPLSDPLITEIVLRSGAAWFLWHLNAENRANRGLLTRYSSSITNTANAHSPIPDIDAFSPFLDSVLGCVESEFMSLPDGRNFLPGERVKGPDYLSMLLRLRN